MKTLSQMERLSSLIIEFPTNMQSALGIDNSEREMPDMMISPYPLYLKWWKEASPDFGHPYSYLSGFQNLRRLSLHGIWGDMGPWKKGITDLLTLNPVEHLAISISYEAEERMANIVFGGPHDRPTSTFAADICESYHQQTQGGRRLKLRTLQLLKTVFPSAEALSKLTDPFFLENVIVETQ